MNNPWFIQKTAQHLGYGRFRSKQIQPIAHSYYEINEQHEEALQALLDRFDGSYENERDTGYAFAPVSQALADWRNLMSAIFPTPENDTAEMEALAATLETWRKSA